MDRYEDAAAHADRIEQELRTLSAWQESPPPDAAFDSETAFFADTMTFYQWLQFVLLPRVREIVAERGSFPRESSVGAYAVRELDGCTEAAGLYRALRIRRLHRNPAPREALDWTRLTPCTPKFDGRSSFWPSP